MAADEIARLECTEIQFEIRKDLYHEEHRKVRWEKLFWLRGKGIAG